jgi:hypothetical protein
MKKFLTLLLSITSLSLLATANIASAATTYPLSPSEAVTEFENFYSPTYDQINADRTKALEEARKWDAEADLYQFNIWWAEGTEPTYAFLFISETNKEEAFHLIKGIDGSLSGGVIERKPEWKYNFTGANLVLRNLIPIMKNDPTLLKTLDQYSDPSRNTSVNFTLRTNLNGRIKWFINFTSDENIESGTSKEYQVIAPADKRWETKFQIKELQRTAGEA